MQTKEKDNLIFIRLFPDEDIHEKLAEAVKEYNVGTAVVIAGIGQLKNFELGYFKEKGNYTPQLFAEPHELLSLSGNISKQNNKYNFHLHAVLGNEDKALVGGHLIKGSVAITNEIILLKTNLKIKRKLEEETGLEGMFLE
jgi:predicted DNA-binding protein with PD1-like motif